MTFLLLSIIIIFFIILSISAQREAKKCGKTIVANNFTVRQSRRNLWPSMAFPITVIINWTPILLTTNNADIFLSILLFMPLSLISFLPIVMWLRWKIIIQDNQITYTPYFGRKKTFTFDYITTVKYGIKMETTKYFGNPVRDYIKVYHDKQKLFYLLDTSNGFQPLVSLLKNKNVPFEWNNV